ncbi:ComF family protein [Leucobacter weissii]|uniref:ComF family protein n=1 Tax=Leucobacter weissii TaxID=1983706 RepID=A0A939SAM6_9MICO|nr:phosphoribosyltransferase family protein [Leucobacter weissii]MBO1900625.1 ComF family protein [Leucobacter weissii]
MTDLKTQPTGLRELGRQFGLDLLALLWPTRCVSCGAPDRDLCDACRADLLAPDRPVLRHEMRAAAPVPVPVRVAGGYGGVLGAVLREYKYGGRSGFARLLGARLRPLIEEIGPVLLVAVPSRPARVRELGYRHVELVVRAALAGLERPAPELMPRALRTLPGRVAQAGLGADARRVNAELVGVRRGARPSLRGRDVVLVDDIITTGASAAACGRALEAAGGRLVGIAALCGAVLAGDRGGSSAVVGAPIGNTGGPGGGDRAETVKFGQGVKVGIEVTR